MVAVPVPLGNEGVPQLAIATDVNAARPPMHDMRMTRRDIGMFCGARPIDGMPHSFGWKAGPGSRRQTPRRIRTTEVSGRSGRPRVRCHLVPDQDLTNDGVD